jgi:arylsulfatase A-like enzyme
MINLVDVLATTAAIVGEKLPPPDKGAEDSRSFLPALIDNDANPPPRADMILHSNDGVFAVRKGPWKWIEGVPVKQISRALRKAHAVEFVRQLYNTHDDPGETKDVSAEHPEVVRELEALLNRCRDQGFSRR